MPNETKGPSLSEVLGSLKLSDEQKAQIEKAASKKGRSRAKSEEEILSTYSHVIKGTLRFDADANKQRATILCTFRPEGKKCKGQRDVYTSDLHQVSVCEPCKKLQAKAKRVSRAKELKEFRDAKEAEAKKTEAPVEA